MLQFTAINISNEDARPKRIEFGEDAFRNSFTDVVVEQQEYTEMHDTHTQARADVHTHTHTWIKWGN